MFVGVRSAIVGDLEYAVDVVFVDVLFESCFAINALFGAVSD